MSAKIPRIIHYCWFGGNPLPELERKCFDSWKKFCPDYEIIRWDENNFNLNYNSYVREAYDAKKYAFVSDVVRLYALVNYGGIYMDTDVEVIKPLDDLLCYEAFSGFESEKNVSTGLMASIKGQPFFLELLHEYDNAHFINSDGSYDITTNVARIRSACQKHGLLLNNTLQTINGLTLFPTEYFCPKRPSDGKTVITDNTYAIHHYSASWKTEAERKTSEYINTHRLVVPKKVAKFFLMIKYGGIREAFAKTITTLRSIFNIE